MQLITWLCDVLCCGESRIFLTGVFCIYWGQHICQIGVQLSLNSPTSPRLCGAFELPVLLEYSRGRGRGRKWRRGEVLLLGYILYRFHQWPGRSHIESAKKIGTYWLNYQRIPSSYLLSKFICRACTSPSTRAEGWNELSCKACRSSRRMRASSAWRCCSFSYLLSALRTSANNASASLSTRFYNKSENVKSC